MRSVCRFGHEQDGRPPPLRARAGPERFGFEMLSHAQREETDGDTVLWLKALWIIHIAREARADLKVLVEQPQDPCDYRPDDPALHHGHGFPTFLIWPETH